MDPIRNGRFSSSEIFRLMKPGKPKGSWSVDADTYIEECNRERRLLRSIENELDAKPTNWGKLVEKRAFDLLGLEYTLCSDKTIQHPEIPDWVGSPDATTQIKVADLKAPFTLNSFCQMVDPWFDKETKTWYDGLTIEALRGGHKDGNKFFYQVLSNAILTNKNKGEIIVYTPYEDELEEIKRLAEGIPEFYQIFYADNAKLPSLNREGSYKNINKIQFDILSRDKEALTERVLECSKKLIPFHKPN